MKKLLSLPTNLVECFHDIMKTDREEWFCTADPKGKKLGSGGGTAWLLNECRKNDNDGMDLEQWIAKEKRILLHAGGQSRRLPAYAPSGKILTPIPVFRWARGQKLNQNLLDLQLPLYENIMEKAPEGINTLIASGDVYIRANEQIKDIPEADVVCYGLWEDAALMKNHGVFVTSRQKPEVLEYMMQKPDIEVMADVMKEHLLMMDIGIWLLSDKAVKLLIDRATDENGNINFYDMYSEFGPALGSKPQRQDTELNKLKVAIIPLPGGEFHHYGTSREMISSTLDVQNCVTDQRAIMQNKVKLQPAVFVQNAVMKIELSDKNAQIWIENSFIGEKWVLTNKNIVTGIPENNWNIKLEEGVCLDIIPTGNESFVVRPYGFDDKFKGDIRDNATLFMGKTMNEWMNKRGIDPDDIKGNDDIQKAEIFPVMESMEDMESVVKWMTGDEECDENAKMLWSKAKKLSADGISELANLRRLNRQREEFRKCILPTLAKNHEKSVFYQTDLNEVAKEFAREGLGLPEELDKDCNLLKRISDSMFRAKVTEINGCHEDSKRYEERAFELMRNGLTELEELKQKPRMDVYEDQIVWGRSPVRIDLAGGWTDTPPYSIMAGGNVLNMAIELNGQQPLQVYVKPSKVFDITLRSIDLGAVETVSTFEELRDYKKVGSPFSIPKAALALTGFLPEFCEIKYNSLAEQLKDFGCGIEITLLSAIPAGSGLGTSSILAATVLGSLNDFCGMKWDKQDLGYRTLVLEQMLTTGGGWQDQYGGILQGVKLLQTSAGWKQEPTVKWMPEYIFRNEEYEKCHLLYYTGITRTAKGILAEIVKGMFLNSEKHLRILEQMKMHTMDMSDAIIRNDFEMMGKLVRKTWVQNQRLDIGTNPEKVKMITDMVDDLCLGYKLPGAGGGGFLYMVAKDQEAAMRIRKILNNNRINNKARFVEMKLSDRGLEVSRS